MFLTNPLVGLKVLLIREMLFTFIYQLISYLKIRLEQHMIKNKLMTLKNYGYRKEYSTEMLLIKVFDDLYKSFDDNAPTVVILLECCF